jgi:hypothetical protein
LHYPDRLSNLVAVHFKINKEIIKIP